MSHVLLLVFLACPLFCFLIFHMVSVFLFSLFLFSRPIQLLSFPLSRSLPALCLPRPVPAGIVHTVLVPSPLPRALLPLAPCVNAWLRSVLFWSPPVLASLCFYVSCFLSCLRLCPLVSLIHPYFFKSTARLTMSSPCSSLCHYCVHCTCRCASKCVFSLLAWQQSTRATATKEIRFFQEEARDTQELMKSTHKIWQRAGFG